MTAQLRGSIWRCRCSPLLCVQMNIDRRLLAGEAFTVPLSVVLEVAVALLGEAEVLAVVVACESLPHHYGAPARLASGSPVRPPPPV